MIGGIAFLGFSSYHYGPISFEDLMTKMEATDGASVDFMLSDGVATDVKNNVRVLPYAKLPDIEGNRVKLHVTVADPESLERAAQEIEI